MPDDLLVTVKQALDDDHGWNWSSLVSGEWTWKPSCVRGWLRLLLDRCATAEAALTARKQFVTQHPPGMTLSLTMLAG